MTDQEKDSGQNTVQAKKHPDKKNELNVKRSLFRKIVNVFISIFLGLLILSLIFFGFTQTKTFREFLRVKVIEIVNKETNGKLNIERIDGTIFTSIFLYNTSIIVDSDTLLYARNIEVKTSPLQLLLKKIYVRKVLLNDVNVSMLQDSAGIWNISKFIKPTPKDTTESSFPFMIQVNDIQLHNINLTHQSFSNLKSKNFYQELNFDDLRIHDLHFAAQAFIDVDNSDYLLILKELSFKPNLNRFTLRNISGEFAVTKNFASVKNFHLITDSSQIQLSARLDSLNLLSDFKLEDFKNYPVSINFSAKPFNFDDLSSFISATEILKGTPSFELKANGKFGGFKVEKCVLDYRDTHFEIEGKVLNLNNPSKLYIQAKINDSDVNYKDVNALLPSLKLPEYALLQLRNANMEFDGEPTNFKSKFVGDIDNGKLSFDGSLNLDTKPAKYDINFETENLNLEPVVGINTQLNSKGSFAGKGFSPMDINSNFKFTATNSSIAGISLDNLNFDFTAFDKKIALNLNANEEAMSTLIKGFLEFDKDTIPAFNFSGRINKLNLSSVLKDNSYDSNFNLRFTADGKNFNPDKLTGFLTFNVDSSRFRDRLIDHSNIECTFKTDSTHREIFLSSDFVDFKIDGNFSLNKAIELATYESKTISGIVSKKIDELNPLYIVQQKTETDTSEAVLPEVVNEDLKFNFDFKFKDFELIAMLIGNERFDISGSGNGSVNNQSGNFSIATQLNLDYIILMQKASTLYISDVNADLNFTRDNRFLSFDKLFGTASITGKRFYSGSNIKSINADIVFNQSKLFFNASANIDDLINADAEGIIFMTPREQQINVNRLAASYGGIEWTNKDTMKVLFNPDYFKIIKCQMQKDTSLVSLSGIIESSGNQNLQLKASRLSGDILGKYLFGFKDNRLKANGSATAKINGEFKNPKMNISVDLNNLEVETTKLGNIKGTALYSDKNLTASIAFLDSTADEKKPLISLDGSFPIDLSFASVEERLLQNEKLSVKLYSTHFDLNSLGRIIPGIVEQKGILKTDINISGTFKEPVFSGNLSLVNGYFKSVDNNLYYSTGVKLHFKDQAMEVDSLVISNAGGTNYRGTITGRGGIQFDGFDTKEINLLFKGELAVLGFQTQAVSPFFYGDLLIETNGDWLLTKRGDKVFFKGNALMKKTDLFYTTGQANGGVSNKDFNIIILEDSSKIDKELQRFNKVLTAEKAIKQLANAASEDKLNFDYEIGIQAKNSSRLTFILGQAANQKLIVELRGDLKYSNISGESRAQGVFELLQGSKLEFFKTFEAVGFLRFESDITNPYLDITSTYTSGYVNPRNLTDTPQDVAVKIKIKSPLSELGKSLASNTESIGVYVAQKNKRDLVLDTRYDYADAFSFILFGKFKDDLTAQDRTNAAGQTSALGGIPTSFLGSIVSNFVNSQVGDLVNDIQISQSGYYTKFSVSGRIQNFSYTLGGTTEAFQSFSKANFGFRYNFTPSFLIRFDRKDPIVSSVGLDEKINEFAIKYKFEF